MKSSSPSSGVKAELAVPDCGHSLIWQTFELRSMLENLRDHYPNNTLIQNRYVNSTKSTVLEPKHVSNPEAMSNPTEPPVLVKGASVGRTATTEV